MNLLRITGLSILMMLVVMSFSCKKEDITPEEPRIRIAIINPTHGSLKGFKSLVENKVLNIEGLQLVAICYNQEERFTASISEYIETQKPLFDFRLLEGKLTADSLFMKNELTDQFRAVFKETDGIFFLGGADIPPNIFGNKTHLLTNITTPKRHYLELSFLFHLIGGTQDTTWTAFLEQRPDFTIAGFCLGMQSINVASGGTMFQDIPRQIYQMEYAEDVLQSDFNQQHRNYWQHLHPDRQMIWANFHQIKAVTDHPFFDTDLFGINPFPFVYSSHHQAVQSTGKGIKIIATSMDEKVPEIIAHTSYKNVFGVQFHPEVSLLYQSNGEVFKWYPHDLQPKSYYDFLKTNNSLKFHQNFWKKIGQLF